MKYGSRKQFSAALVVGILLGSSNIAQAACNSAKNWFEAPGPEIKVFVGYKQEQRPGFGSFGVSQTAIDYPYPDPLAKEMLGKEGGGMLSEGKTSDVSYYEPDGKGNLRVCRVEGWWPPSFGSEALRKALRPSTERYVANNLVLKKLGAGNVALNAVLYFYDNRGRLVRLEEGEFEKPEMPAVIKICREYDEDDNLTLLLDPKNSQRCLARPPDVRDEWLRYRYGKYDGKQVELLDEWHRGNAAGKWSKNFGAFRTGTGPNAVYGAAKAKMGKGVTVIYGSNAGKLDDNAANTVLDSFGRVNAAAYFFTQRPTPLEVLEKPETIYQYERRRQTYIDGEQVKLFELFKPNEHRSRHRYYVQFGVVRHEQLDASGRVRRVITLNDWRQPRPGPDPDVNDKLLTDKGVGLIGHQIYHRVYDFDAQGKPTLVALSWNRRIRLNPLKKTHIDSADVVYGTPAGKVRWKTKEEFEAHFDFSPIAAQVFPDKVHGEEPEEI